MHLMISYVTIYLVLKFMGLQINLGIRSIYGMLRCIIIESSDGFLSLPISTNPIALVIC